MDEEKGCKGRGQGSWGRTEAVGFGHGREDRREDRRPERRVNSGPLRLEGDRGRQGEHGVYGVPRGRQGAHGV